MPKRKRTPSLFISLTGWGFTLASGLYLPLAALQTFAIFSLYSQGVLTDYTITAFNPIEVVFYSNLRVFVALMLSYNLIFLISSIALLKRRGWARVSLSVLLGLALLSLGAVGAAYLRYDYEFTAWSDPERNRRFVRNAFAVALATSLLLLWLIYKLNTRKIVEKLS